MKEEKQTNKDHCASNTLKKSEHSKYHGDRTQRNLQKWKVFQWEIQNILYTLRPQMKANHFPEVIIKSILLCIFLPLIFS